jgi:hypothetical protein
MNNNMNKKMHFVMSEHDPDKLRQANRPEWMLTVHDCRGETQEKINCSSYGEACEVIGNVAQHKLLTYLLDMRCYLDTDGNPMPNDARIKFMLKQLEAINE